MNQTPNLGLPYIAAAQAQKHVTHNEALDQLDAVIHISVIDRQLDSPPEHVDEGSRYIVALDAQDLWQDQENTVASFLAGGWRFHTPGKGWLAYVESESQLVVWNGESWSPINEGAALSESFIFDMAGINATPDETNRFSVASPASLFSHAGEGHQAKINKASESDTASLLFQTDFSGRAEMGTAGDDNFHFKVSPDGAIWHEAIIIDAGTGAVSLPNTALAAAGSQAGFEVAYTASSQSIPHSSHTVVSDITLGTDDLEDTTFASGVWTVGEADAGLWLMSAFAQINSVSRLILTLEVSQDDGASWNVAFRGQDTSDSSVSRIVSLTPFLEFSAGDKFRFLVLQQNGSSAASNLVFFTLTAKKFL